MPKPGRDREDGGILKPRDMERPKQHAPKRTRTPKIVRDIAPADGQFKEDQRSVRPSKLKPKAKNPDGVTSFSLNYASLLMLDTLMESLKINRSEALRRILTPIAFPICDAIEEGKQKIEIVLKLELKEKDNGF